jgi:hypothetical protein
VKVKAQVISPFQNLLEGLVEDVILVGHKRKELGVLITLKVRQSTSATANTHNNRHVPLIMSPSPSAQAELDEQFAPTEKLAPSALEVLKDIGSVAATVPQCINGAHAEKLSEHILTVRRSCWRESAHKTPSTAAHRRTNTMVLFPA